MNRNKIDKLLAFGVLVFITFNHLQGQVPPSSPSRLGMRRFYQGVRGLGMGGAQISTVNDETAIFINPAHLLRLRDSVWSFVNFDLDIGDTFYHPIYATKSFGSPINPQEVFQSLSQNPGVTYHFRGTVTPVISSQYLSFGLIQNWILTGRISQDQSEADVRYRDDQGLFLGTAVRFFDGHIKIGAAAKIISRVEIDETRIWPSVIDVDSQARSGTGIGSDIGITMTAPWVWHPTLSLVVRNAGDIKFDQTFYQRLSSNPNLETEKQTLDLGFALFPIHGPSSRSAFALEFSDLEEYSSTQVWERHVHLGYEWNYKDVVFVRFGANQLDWTMGLEVVYQYTQLQFAWYAEDVGPHQARNMNRRWAFRWSLRF